MRLLVLPIVSFVSSCAFWLPKDLHLTNVSAADAMQDPQIRGTYAYTFDDPRHIFLKITFGSAFDLVAQNEPKILGMRAAFCDQGRELPSATQHQSNLSYPGVYAYGTEIGIPGRPIPRKLSTAPVKLYYVYIPVMSVSRGPSWSTWDLKRDPHDVCLVIETGSYIHSQSNVVVVPKEVIETALLGVSAAY